MNMVFIQHEVNARKGHGNAPDSLPETFKQLTDKKFAMGGKLDAYIWDLWLMLNPTMSAKDFLRNWCSFWTSSRAFSNKCGWNSGDFKYENLYCGGATFNATGNVRKRFGVLWTEVYAIDPLRPPIVTIEWVRTLHFFPVINTTASVPGSKMTQKTPFPQFNGNCPLPLVGDKGRAWVQRAVPATSIQSPYFT